MRLRSVEENGNVTVITGSFFGNLNLTTHNKEGELICEFSGTALEMREMQKMTQDESKEYCYGYGDSSEESGPNIEEEEDQENTVENGSDIKEREFEEEPETCEDDGPNFEPGDKVELINNSQTTVYGQGDILTVIKHSKIFNNNYEVAGSDNRRRQIISRDALKPLGKKSKFFIINKKGEDISSTFKEGTIVKVIDEDITSSTRTVSSDDTVQVFGLSDFKGVAVDEKGLDDGIKELFEFAKEKDIRLAVDNLDEVKEQKEKGVNKIKLQPNTLYYLKEKIYDNSGDSVGPGLVTFDDRFAVGFIDQYGKAPVAIDSHYLEKDKIFKVKRRDIVKVVSNEKTNNGVVGKTGFLLRSGELVKGKSLIGPYVVLEEVEPVSDKKAQKFFEKEIAKTRTRG